LVVFKYGLLGVKPLTPGYRRFSVAPKLGNLNLLSGVLTTPFGDIKVSVEHKGDRRDVQVEAPDECQWVQNP
ncbi:MAG: alpha-L-rhamnosidase C-terminal domain-containing protein, partial [Fimbriimonadaceae bacterium]